MSFGVNSDGTRQRKWRSGATKNEVLTKLAKLRGDQDFGSADKTGFSQFAKKWLALAVENNAAGASLAAYRVLLTKHIEPAIGYLYLSKIGPAHIENLKASLRRKKLAGNTQRNIMSTLSRVLEQAVLWKLIPANPCNSVTSPRASNREFSVYDGKQAETLLTACADGLGGPIIAIALQSGARQGELIALRWTDVDWDKSSITIRRTISDGDGAKVVKEPKTAAGRRTIDLSPGAMETLREQRKALVKLGLAKCELVFPDSKGEMINRRTLQGQFRRMTAELGLPQIRFHDLRHTHATLLLTEGINPKVVQERLGHSSINITLDTYSHVLPRVKSEAVERLSKLLG